MKKSKQKKLVLDNSELIDEFFEEIKLIGLVTPLASYQLIWRINEAFHFNFKRDHENEVNCKDVYFSVYSFVDTAKSVEHYIFCNRHFTDYLMPEAKNIDFIWMIKGGHYISQLEQTFITLLSQLDEIDHHFSLNHANLPSKQHLIL